MPGQGPPAWTPPPMHVPGSLLAQGKTDDISANTIFSATQKTEITNITIANTTTTATQYTIYHSDTGDTSGTPIYSTSTALYWGILLPGNSSDSFTREYPGDGIQMAAGARIGFKSEQTGNFTYSIYGVVSRAR